MSHWGCGNVIWRGAVTAGCAERRDFSFAPGNPGRVPRGGTLFRIKRSTECGCVFGIGRSLKGLNL